MLKEEDMDYIAKFLPCLTNEEKEVVESFHIIPVG